MKPQITYSYYIAKTMELMLQRSCGMKPQITTLTTGKTTSA